MNNKENMTGKSVVYLHRRGDNSEVFYVGHGSVTRPKNKARRNKKWFEIVDSVGYTIEILHCGLSKQEAIRIEDELIKSLPNLVNDKKVNSLRLPLDFDLMNEYFIVDETSPTGLRWKKWNGGTKPMNKKLPGDVAGFGFYRPNGDKSGMMLSFKGSKYAVHRVVWLLSGKELNSSPDFVIDHINNDPFDNRISNLRQVSYQVNSLNVNIRKDNKSGVQGVTYAKMGNTFYYSATWRENSSVKSKHFSVVKYGKEEALRLASEYRARMYNRLYADLIPELERTS